MKLTFLGGVGTVTGSKYLVESHSRRVLIDCGLFQGLKQLRLRNWEALPIEASSIDSVVLTHAHLDHSGYLPLLVRKGFTGPVICTPTTRDLCGILLPDSGRLQEQDADFANRHGFSKHRPALPLYTEKDARIALRQLVPLAYGTEHDLGGGLSVRFGNAAHILGSAFATLSQGATSIVFSGDLGRRNSPLMPDPDVISEADYVVVESTYGDRLHDSTGPEDLLADVIARTAARGGKVLIPAFAVGRTQLLLYYVDRLKRANRIPALPVFIDSPMAVAASDLLFRHQHDHRLSAAECAALGKAAVHVTDVEQSKSIDQSRVPMVVISASGMATGGRVLHHIKAMAPDPRNTILFAGYQAAGTRGAAMTHGAREVKIHGAQVPVRAEVANLEGLSAHADANEVLDWLRHLKVRPRTTFVTHGEPAAAEALRSRIERELKWTARVPDYRDSVELA